MKLADSIHEAVALGESYYALVPEMTPLHERVLLGLSGISVLLWQRCCREE